RAPADLARPPGLPREEARLRPLHARAAVPERRYGDPTDPRRHVAEVSQPDAADAEAARVTPVVGVGAFVFDAPGRVLVVERRRPGRGARPGAHRARAVERVGAQAVGRTWQKLTTSRSPSTRRSAARTSATRNGTTGAGSSATC